jgi:hypothetical protein
VRGELGSGAARCRMTVFVLEPRYTSILHFQDTLYSEISNLLILYKELTKLDYTTSILLLVRMNAVLLIDTNMMVNEGT